MTTSHIPAIDVHAHYGTYHRPDSPPLIDGFMSADGATVAAMARRANIQTTIVSPLLGLMPRGKPDVVRANDDAARTVITTPGLLQCAIVHPLIPETYTQAAIMLDSADCVGIKIHPEEHCYQIREHGEALFEFAARHQTVVLTHSGDPRSRPQDFVPFADRYPEVRLILAHLGNGGAAGGNPTLQVRAIQDARSQNVYVDTSSARSFVPNLLEWAVGEIGPARILFGTDTPLYCPSMQRIRVDHADLSDADKMRILCENARELFRFNSEANSGRNDVHKTSVSTDEATS